MTSRKHTKIAGFLSLALFLLLTLFINFLHTEDSLQASKSCPACHFQNSTLATNPTPFFLLPRLALLEMLKILDALCINSPAYIESASRSPPCA